MSSQKRSPLPQSHPTDAEGHAIQASSQQQNARNRMPKLRISPDIGEKYMPSATSHSARLPTTQSIHTRSSRALTDRSQSRTTRLEAVTAPRKSSFRAKTTGTRLSLPLDWKIDSARHKSAPLPGLGLADFQLSDFQSYTQGQAEKMGQLDNWPSTNTQGSKSWLGRLEAYVDARMETVVDGDIEQEALAYHECFAKFIEDFKNYKPVLSRIYHAYQKFIEYAQVSLRRVSELEFEMYSLQERTREEVRRSHVEAANKLKDMEAALIAAKANEQKAIRDLDKAVQELAVAKADVDKEKDQRDKLEEVNKAYCSGYKWIIKHVAKADEPSDLDAMETVTLIQKLERAIADANNSRFQMEYLQRTSEVVQAKTTLEEERRLFGEETERMQSELDNLRHSENAVSRQYRQAKAANEGLEEEVNNMREQLEGMFLMHLGHGDEVPPLLRTKRPIVNRQTSRDEAAEITTLIFKEALDRYNTGVYPHMEEVLVHVLSEYYHEHNTAEWTRNFLDAIEDSRDDVPDFALVGGCLAESLGQQALLSRCTFFADLADRLTALAFKKSKAEAASRSQGAAAASPNPPASEASPDTPASSAATFEDVAVEDLIAEMQWIFGLKPQEHQDALCSFLTKDAVRGQSISIQRIRGGSPLGFEEELVELLQGQLVEEVRSYAAEMRRTMVATTGKRKSRQAVPQIGVMEMREVLLSMEPDKANEDIAMVIWRGFSLTNYEEAYSIVVPEEDNAEEWGRTPSEAPEIPMEPIDRVLHRLSVANLLHKTAPEPLPMPPTPPPPAAARPPTSGENEGKEPAAEEGETAAAATEPALSVLSVEHGRFKAMKEGLEAMANKPIPRWARKADAAAKKPFLNALVQAYQAKTKLTVPHS